MNFLEFDSTRYFPYYNHNPRISKTGWIVLLLSVPISYIVYMVSTLITNSEIISGLLFCLIMLVPLLYYSNWDYSLFIYKPTKNEIILAVVMFIGYMIYSLSVGTVLDTFGLSGVETTAEAMGITIESTIGLVFSMMGEELLKFIPLMFLMRFIYKFSDNRKLAIIVSAIIVMIGFGLLHYAPPYSTLASVILLQGFGTIFEMYGYLKTKNILVPYISHLLTDAVVFTVFLMGF
ncbi:MAG: hypothetical protein IJL02_11355 [Methanobrevibacter sp.]|uniref:CPBP family glutamic-type intramembrane protease n=1 Tax=Methanobrevibacter sp. TaxID=66852 RepID=UPI0025EF3F9B|nr:CPBP family glutamic-type intramembrane protease [Methanobrevibacter sp.]MBQ6100442.1 hypothetical protein [Methanobrevibacter sp.]